MTPIADNMLISKIFTGSQALVNTDVAPLDTYTDEIFKLAICRFILYIYR